MSGTVCPRETRGPFRSSVSFLVRNFPVSDVLGHVCRDERLELRVLAIGILSFE